MSLSNGRLREEKEVLVFKLSGHICLVNSVFFSENVLHFHEWLKALTS